MACFNLLLFVRKLSFKLLYLEVFQLKLCLLRLLMLLAFLKSSRNGVLLLGHLRQLGLKTVL